MEWKFLITGEGDKKSELKDIIGEEEYNKLLGEIQESLKEPAPSYSIEYKRDRLSNGIDINFTSENFKNMALPKRDRKTSLLKEQIMEEYGYGDNNDFNPNYKLTGYRNPTWLGLITEKCKIYGVVEKAKYLIYFFSEIDMIPHLKSIDVLSEEEHKLNKFQGQEFIDEVNNIAKTVKIYLLFKEDSNKEVENED